MDRRQLILGGIATGFCAALLGRPAHAQRAELEVFKSPACGCCAAWIEHMTSEGFEARARDVDQETLWALKARAGVTLELSSCHTAFVDEYSIEGHVAASDVRRLLDERPDALGLTVPGMPIGSPGMEIGTRRDAYDTLLVLRDGSTEVFASHA